MYNEVATPLLFDIVVEYLNNAVVGTSLSATNFSNYYNGSELVISGLFTNEDLRTLPIRITAVGSDGPVIIEEDVDLRVRLNIRVSQT